MQNNQIIYNQGKIDLLNQLLREELISSINYNDYMSQIQSSVNYTEDFIISSFSFEIREQNNNDNISNLNKELELMKSLLYINEIKPKSFKNHKDFDFTLKLMNLPISLINIKEELLLLKEEYKQEKIEINSIINDTILKISEREDKI